MPGWAMSFYTGMWSLMREDGESDRRAAAYRERVGRFADEYQFLFGGDGGPIHIGRSLTYRWAACAPLWLAMRLGTSSVRPGTVRRIASQCLRYFTERGAVDQATGLLTVGWHGPNEHIAQSYTRPSSPYWAAKGFLGLALEANHPAWTDAECPAPIDAGDFVRVIPAPGCLVQGTQDDGVVRVYNHGSDHFPWFAGSRTDPHYRKIGYSTVTGPELTDSTDTDSQVVFRSQSGATGQRQRITGPALTARRRVLISSRSSRSMDGASLGFPRSSSKRITLTIPRGIQLSRKPFRVQFDRPREDWFSVRLYILSVARMGVEARVVRCVTPYPGLVDIGGFAVADDQEPAAASGTSHASAWGRDGLRSTIFALSHPAECTVLPHAFTNSFGARSAAPVATFPVTAGESLLVAVTALGKRAGTHEQCPVTSCEASERSITLTWKDQEAQTYRFNADSWKLIQSPSE